MGRGARNEKIVGTNCVVTLQVRAKLFMPPLLNGRTPFVTPTAWLKLQGFSGKLSLSQNFDLGPRYFFMLCRKFRKSFFTYFLTYHLIKIKS